MSAHPPEPITPPALISAADLRTLAELHDAESSRTNRRILGSWSAVAGAHHVLQYLARAIHVLECGRGASLQVRRAEDVQPCVDVLQIYLGEARDNWTHHEKIRPDPILATSEARRVGALERALAELRPLAGVDRLTEQSRQPPRLELADAGDRQRERPTLRSRLAEGGDQLLGHVARGGR